MTSRHPELASEQQYLEDVHDFHEETILGNRALVNGVGNGGGDANAQRIIRDNAVKALERLESVDTSRLIFGRLDFAEGKVRTIYVGPCTVLSNGKVRVVDFASKVARPFYMADEHDPLGLDRRRSFDLFERELRDISDEDFGTAPGELDASSGSRRSVLDRVAEDLERAREPRMQAIVASIVADQYRLIEAPREGVFIVQGGPGTGKTAVALHRAVFLLRNHEELGKVLVVGPNAAFMAYIAGVLPGLGETTVDQVAIGRLPETGEAQARGFDPPDLAALKGDARMAQVIEKAVRQRIRPASEPYSLSTQGVIVQLDVDAANAVLKREVHRERPYMEGRRRFVEAMRGEVDGLLQARIARSPRRRTVDRESLGRDLAGDRIWNNFLERMWPTTSAAQIVHELFTIEQRLRSAASGILTEDELPLLLRRGIRTVGVHPWTADDMPLIDEAQALVQGVGAEYGYVIVDEAQDLTPIQLRMIARRSKNGDLTLVGDIAQATGPTRYRNWDEIATHLPTARGVRSDQLNIGYRVPRSIMELANLILPMIAPGLPVTEPVREARVDPRFEQVEEAELADAVAVTVAELTTDDRSVGVIAPQSHVTAIRGALAARGLAAGDISTDQLEKRVTLLSSADAKGLEFDRVVLVEPWDIVTLAQAGWSELYVALSRATQQLVVMHSGPLPAPLPGGEPVVLRAVVEAKVASADVQSSDGTVDGAPELDLELDIELVVPDRPLARTATVDELPAEPAVRLEVQPADIENGSMGIAATADPPSVVDDAAPPETESLNPPNKVVASSAEPLVAPGPAAPIVVGGPAHSRAITPLGGSFSEAIVYTKLLHDGRTRRGTAVPYLSHLLATAALVLEDGGSEAEAIAALLHDAVEDGPPGIADTIRARFGPEVVDIVVGCSDPVVAGGFREVKVEQARELEHGSTSMRRVALAEKLDNARALLRDLERYGADTWARMEVDREDMLWYLRSMVMLFDRSFPSVLADELRRVVDEIEVQVA